MSDNKTNKNTAKKPKVKPTAASNPFLEKLRNEPLVSVHGSEVYKQFCGDVYTFLYNGVCVSIKFDGQDYQYPATIAKALNRKLAAISKANTPKVINTKI